MKKIRKEQLLKAVLPGEKIFKILSFIKKTKAEIPTVDQTLEGHSENIKSS